MATDRRRGAPRPRAAHQTDEERERFAALFRQLRQTAGRDKEGNPAPVSFRELSRRTNGMISHQYLYFIEHGMKGAPRNVKQIEALADALGNTSFEELMAAAGYTRQAGRAGSKDLSQALAELGLDEDTLDRIESFIAFEIQAAHKGRRRSNG